MRFPAHKRAERELERVNDELRGEGLPRPHRNAIPPSAWDDIIVSYWRGQSWARRNR